MIIIVPVVSFIFLAFCLYDAENRKKYHAVVKKIWGLPLEIQEVAVHPG